MQSLPEIGRVEMRTKRFLFFVISFTILADGYCKDETKSKRSLISKFTSNPLFSKFFHHYDDYQSPAYTATWDGNFSGYQAPGYSNYQTPGYSDSWDGNYEYSYVTPEEASEDDSNDHYDGIDTEEEQPKIAKEKQKPKIAIPFSEDFEDYDVTTQKQIYFFNTLPFYERIEPFRNLQNEHIQNRNTEEKRNETNNRSDIPFDEDREEYAEENQPLFNSLPLYETTVTFRNHEKSDFEEKHVKIAQEKIEDDRNQVFFNLLPFYELAKRFMIPEANETQSFLPSKDRLLAKIDRNDTIVPIRPRYQINWLVNANGEMIPQLPIFRLAKNITEESKRQEKKVHVKFDDGKGTEYDINLTCNNSTDGDGLKPDAVKVISLTNKHEDFITPKPVENDFITSQPIKDDFITSQPVEDDFITSQPIEDDFVTSDPVALRRNPAFLSRVNPALVNKNEDGHVSSSLPLYDNLDRYFQSSNGSLERNEERDGRKIETQASVVHEAGTEVNLTNHTLEEAKAQEIFQERNAKKLGIRPTKDENVHKNLIQENVNSLEMPKTSVRIDENTLDEETNGIPIYIFKSLPYFDRFQPFSSIMATIMNNTEGDLVKTQRKAVSSEDGRKIISSEEERKLVSSEEDSKLASSEEGRKLSEVANEEKKVKEEKKKSRGRRRKVKKILVARRNRNDLAAMKGNAKRLHESTELRNIARSAFGDRTEPRMKITSFKHTGHLPLAGPTYPEYKVDSTGAPLNFTYDVNVLNQLNNNLINKTM